MALIYFLYHVDCNLVQPDFKSDKHILFFNQAQIICSGVMLFQLHDPSAKQTSFFSVVYYLLLCII